jgi:ABC-type lipoprotein release transport system permease subunit
MALGATQEKVLRAVLEDGVRLAVPGLLLGALLAVAMAAGMQRMLLGVSPLDPISLGAAAAVLLVVVMLASAAPARRASKVDPMDALRWE